MEPLELLFEKSGMPAFALPPALGRLYPGTLGFTDDCLFANFVESLDGAVAIPDVPSSNKLIAGASEPDQFVMALLRACADVVLVGSGTLHASPTARWVAESAYPAAADAFAELRRALHLGPEPALAVVTTGKGYAIAFEELPREPIVLTPTTQDDAAVDIRAAVDALRQRGFRRILCEGGPTLFGSLLDAGLVDELFLTLSPIVAGRTTAAKVLTLVEESRYLPDRRVAASLLSVRRAADHLFLRYSFR
jgi:riboflavin biosynthesis pyrimidine reductase